MTLQDYSSYILNVNSSPYIWLGHLYEGSGIAKTADAIPVELNPDMLCLLLLKLRSTLQHNFFPGLLVIGACGISLLYNTIMAKYLNCLVAIAFGPSGQAKLQPYVVGCPSLVPILIASLVEVRRKSVWSCAASP